MGGVIRNLKHFGLADVDLQSTEYAYRIDVLAIFNLWLMAAVVVDVSDHRSSVIGKVRSARQPPSRGATMRRPPTTLRTAIWRGMADRQWCHTCHLAVKYMFLLKDATNLLHFNLPVYYYTPLTPKINLQIVESRRDSLGNVDPEIIKFRKAVRKCRISPLLYRRDGWSWTLHGNTTSTTVPERRRRMTPGFAGLVGSLREVCQKFETFSTSSLLLLSLSGNFFFSAWEFWLH
jgi:hypothetical protein